LDRLLDLLSLLPRELDLECERLLLLPLPLLLERDRRLDSLLLLLEFERDRECERLLLPHPPLLLCRSSEDSSLPSPDKGINLMGSGFLALSGVFLERDRFFLPQPFYLALEFHFPLLA
jgi:hypothetical protein